MSAASSPQSRVLLVGDSSPWGLAQSYARAFRALGWHVAFFDVDAAVQRHSRFGPVGRFASRRLFVEPWARKANRELMVAALEWTPQIVVVFGNNAVQAGTLGQLAASLTTRLLLVWPDSLVNLADRIIDALPVYDLVASYSATVMGSFQRLGARRVEWVPFAADTVYHDPGPLDDRDSARYGCDIAFIGNWRPEREEALSRLCRAGRWSVRIWGGPSWDRWSRRPVRRAWQGHPLFGRELAKACRAAKVNLNIIDPTNYPAGNMRVFEILAARGLEVCSPCSELAGDLRDGQHLYYYVDLEHLLQIVPTLLGDATARQRVAAAGHSEVLGRHTYVLRVQQLLSALGQPAASASPAC